MIRKFWMLAITMIALFTLTNQAGAQTAVSVATQTRPAKSTKPTLPNAKTRQPSREQIAAIAAMPLTFEKNMGQVDKRAGYLSRMSNYTLFLTGSESVLVHNAKEKNTASALKLRWLGASNTVTPQGDAEVRGKSNYLIGNDSSKWHSNVPNYQRVREDSLYPGIDLVYYGNQKQLEYDLNIAPGADPAAIKLAIDGAKKLSIDKATGDLVILDEVGSELRLRKPTVYQQEGEQNTSVPGSYVLSAGNTVSFEIGGYDRAKPLVIDPTVVYSTLFGSVSGTDCYNSNCNDSFAGMAVDSGGDVYLLITTYAMDVPTTTGAYQTSCSTSQINSSAYCNSFMVAKFDPTQSGAASLIYSTYIGGPTLKGTGSSAYNADNNANALAVDADGDVYFTGNVVTTSYPTTAGAYTTYAAACAYGTATYPCLPAAVISKLDPTGSTLLYSSYLPMGNSKNNISGTETDSVGSLAIDGNQIAYIAGMGSPGLPTTDKSTCAIGCVAGYVTAIDTTKSGSASLVYAVYLPVYPINAMAVDPVGDVYLGGVYSPTGIPGLTAQTITFNGYQTTQAAHPNAMQSVLLRLNHAGQNIYAASVASGAADNNYKITAISVDSSGNAYFAGQLNNTTPQVNGLVTTASFTGPGPYLAKVDTNNTGSTSASLLYATYIAPDKWYGQMFSLSCNNAGQVAFAGLAGENTTAPGFSLYTQVNPITQPALTYATQYPPFVGILDTTQTGNDALTFLSFPNGVWNPDRIVLSADADGYPILDLGGYSKGAVDPQDQVIFVPGSYSTTDGGAGMGNPFFYKISLAAIPQTITFTDSLPTSATYSAGLNYTLSATGGASGNPVTFAITTGSGIANITGGNTLNITGIGTVTITANQAGNSNYAAATPVSQSFTVAPAALTVTANNASRAYGAANPAFTYAITGFVNSDTSAVVSGSATEATTATTTSNAGTYPITFSTQSLTAANYTFTYVSGTLTVTGGAAQSITFGALSGQTYGASPVTLGATASSGLAVSYAVTGPATVSGSTLTITGAGLVTVTASQAGNSNYAAATPVSQSFTVAPAALTVTANNASRAYGAANPAFTYAITGFVNSDTSAVVSGSATETTTAIGTSSNGSYPISFSTESLTAANYTFNYINGTLTVTGAPAVVLTTTVQLAKVAGGYLATITVLNSGTGPAANVQLTSVTLGAASGTPVPQNLGTLAAAGGSTTVTVNFPATAGNPGATVVEKLAGSYTGGSFSTSLRVVLPAPLP